MLIIGHRGAPLHLPENTLPSFDLAINQGAEMIELDIYSCATGELVVIHDDRVNRTTNGTGFVIDKTLEELRELDAGEGEKIPTLEEVLNLVRGRVPVNIELKGPGTALALHRFLLKYNPEFGWDENELIVSSFNLPELLTFKNYRPHIRRGALNGGIPLDLGAFADPIEPWSLHYSIEFFTEEMVQDAHNRGQKVFLFTVDHCSDRDKYEFWGVDGIFTNSPEKMLKC